MLRTEVYFLFIYLHYIIKWKWLKRAWNLDFVYDRCASCWRFIVDATKEHNTSRSFPIMDTPLKLYANPLFEDNTTQRSIGALNLLFCFVWNISKGETHGITSKVFFQWSKVEPWYIHFLVVTLAEVTAIWKIRLSWIYFWSILSPCKT